MSALELFEKLGGRKVDPEIVIDVTIPLDLSGEAIRGRVCTFTDESGREWALRPDLTVPVALMEIEQRLAGRTDGESFCFYQAPVFRLPMGSEESVEYEQVGFERYGAVQSARADAEAFALITHACEAYGVDTGNVTFGDLWLFPAFVDDLELSPETAEGLKRAFRQEGGVRAFLRGQDGRTSNGLSERMRGMSREAAAAFVEDILALTGIQTIGERTSDEIVERLYQRATTGGAESVPDEKQGLIREMLEVDAPFESALQQLGKLLKPIGAAKAAARIEALFETLKEIKQQVRPEWIERARFSTRFGRRFAYYDGLAFEVSRCSGEPAFAAGGRYDELLGRLSSGRVKLAAIGGIVIPHRLQAVRETVS